MAGNDGGSILHWVVPDFVAPLALAHHLTTETEEMAGQLSIRQAGTRTGTRQGVVTVSTPRGNFC
jgi:hypothetical protein